jgi:hypothetical protein
MPPRRHRPSAPSKFEAPRPRLVVNRTAAESSEPPPPSDERRRIIESICGFLPGELTVTELKRQAEESAALNRRAAALRAEAARRREWLEWSLKRYGNGNGQGPPQPAE